MNSKPKYKLKSKTKEPNKFVQGTQSLNALPDYSFYYDSQNDAYNRRTRESAVNNTVLNPIAGAIGKTNFTGITSGVSDFIDTRTIQPDGKQDIGAGVASSAIKYGGLGASIGSAAGPIGTAIVGGIGALAGGIYGGINAKNINNRIDIGKRLDKTIADYYAKGNTVYNYNVQGDINSQVAKAQGFAKKGKYKLKGTIEVDTKLDLPNPNARRYKSRYKDYRKKPTR